MAFKPYRQINLNSDETVSPKHINAVQANISSALQQILGKDTLDSQLLKNIQLLPAIVNKVSHGLGRELQGYYVVRNHGSYSVIRDTQDDNLSPHLLLFLTTPALCTVDLLVF